MSETKKPAGLFGNALRKNKRNKKVANFSKKSETASNVSSHATVDSNNDLDVAVPATVDACNKSSVAVPALIGSLGPMIQADVQSRNVVRRNTKRHSSDNTSIIGSDGKHFVEPVGLGSDGKHIVEPVDLGSDGKHFVEPVGPTTEVVAQISKKSVPFTEPITENEAYMSTMHAFNIKSHNTVESNNDLVVDVPATVDACNKSSVAVTTTDDAKIESGVALQATAETNNASGVVVVPAFGRSIGSDASAALHVTVVECTLPIDPIIKAVNSNGSPFSVGSPFFGFTPPQGDEFLSDDEPFFGFSPQNDFHLKRKSINITGDNDYEIASARKRHSSDFNDVADKYHDIESDFTEKGSSKIIDQNITFDSEMSQRDVFAKNDFVDIIDSDSITKDIIMTPPPINESSVDIDPLYDNQNSNSDRSVQDISDCVVDGRLGEFCQYNYGSHVHSSSHTCCAISVVALLYSAHALVHSWSATELNTVIDLGIDFYQFSLLRFEERFERSVPNYMKPYELAEQITVEGKTYVINANAIECNGQINSEDLLNAFEYLNTLEFNFAILVINSLSYGVIVCRIDESISYVLFDSHGRTSDGQRFGEYSAVLFFDNVYSIVQLLCMEFNQESSFVLFPINFEFLFSLNDEQSQESMTPEPNPIDGKFFYKIVLGDMSQQWQYFPKPHDQCTAMAAVAMAYVSIKSPEKWTAQDLNEIIVSGQIYYNNCLPSLPNGRSLLEVFELIKEFKIDSRSFRLTIAVNSCRGGVHDNRNNLFNAIVEFERNELSLGIITYKSYSYGLIRCQKNRHSSYVFFDSHGRADDGTRPGEKSAIMFFNDADAFVDFFISEYPLLGPAGKNETALSRSLMLVPLYFTDISNENINNSVIVPSDEANNENSSDSQLLPHELFTKVVSGTFAQNDSRFDAKSRNTQCTANSVVFLAFASVLKGKWTGLDIDRILMLGDHIYTVSYQAAIKTRPRSHSFLAANEIIEKIFVTVSRFDCGVITAICKPLIEKEFSGNFGKFALRYIERFFASYTSGVFICTKLSVALHRFEDQYIIFDPHARNADGIQKSDGTANIFIFSNIRSLYKFLSKYGSYNTLLEFTLTPFDITHENDVNERVKIRGGPTKNLKVDGDDFCSDDDDIPLPLSPEWDDSDNIPLIKLIKPTVVITDDIEPDSGSETESVTSVRSMPEPKSMFLEFSDAHIENERKKMYKKRSVRRVDRTNYKISLTSEKEQGIRKRWRAYLEKLRRTHTPRVFKTKQELKDFYDSKLNDGCDEEIVKATDIALANLLLIEEHRRLRMLHTSKFPKHFQAFGNHENIDESKKAYELHTLSAMDQVCEFCGAKYFKEELNTKKQFTLCCNLGEIHSELREKQAMNYPHQLKTLLLRESPLSDEFMQNILLYNNVLSFASMGATDFRHLSATGSIGPVVAIQGMIYHIAEHFRTNSTGDGMPTAQLYYVDTNTAVDERLQRTHVTLNRSLLIQLEGLMRTINPFTDAYRMLSEVLNEVRRRPNGNATEVHLQIVRKRNAIQMRQNHGGDFGLPTSNEVAAVYTERPDPRTKNLVIFPVDKPAEDGISIHSTDPNRDAMMYPILFPKGEQTWSYNLFRRKKETEKEKQKDEEKDVEENSEQEEDSEQEEETDEEEVTDKRKTKKRSRITLREFYCFLFMVCNVFSPILNAGKLSQQYIIDAYSRCQENTFEYLESPRGQAQIRAETYGALMDYMEKKKVFQPDIPGKLIVMPNHIAGSRQYMQEKYSDAMAMVTRFGKPTFFLTMTCNPMWDDIRNSLPKNANPIDHPGVVARVFRAKQKAFIKDLQENHVMGKFVAYVSVVEWQKRSLPHCHLMLWTTEEDKPASALDIDGFVSAEIPNQKTQPRLYKAVTSFMYHHRCDTGDNASCLRPKKNGKGNECSKNFPKNFDDQSKLVEGSYPIYRRRENGRTFMSVKGQEIDNKWIVPYNPYLLLKYNCHLNVEIVSNVKSLKYLFKYFHKGLDMARLKVQIIDNVQVFNEFEHYVDSRYLSAGEAIWKIYGFPVFQKSHAVYALPVHLENYQRVIFNVDNPEAALDHPDSKLTAFFKLNQTDPMARQYLYTDIPYHYVYDEKKRIWKRRQRGQVVTRIHLVNYNNIELYSLRMLLYVVKGPESYEDIRKIDGVQYDTFRQAAIALGLLEDDSFTIETFKEIINVELPHRIRSLFVQMLLWCTPTDPLAIWNEFKKYMYEDYVKKKCSPELSENLALKHISYLLTAEGKSNSTFDLPEPILSREDLQQAEATNVPLNNARTFDRAEEENDGKQLSAMLNSDQRCIFDTIMDSVHNRNAPDQQKLFFVDGPGGTGKTFLFSSLISSIRGMGLNVLATAWTGIAAILMKGGKTAHSAFKLPFNINGAFSCGVSLGSDYANELNKIDVIIWDEISMTISHALDAVDAFFRALMKNDLPFGGKIFCCTGDFRQILPIVPGGSKADILAILVKKSKVWALLQKHALSVNVRLTDANDLAFARWQLDIGEGKLHDYPANEYYNGYVKIPAECIEPNSIVDRIYGKTFKSSDIAKYSNTAILTTLNEDVEFLNKAIYSRMTEDVPTETCYYSTDKVNGIEADDDDSYDVKMLNSLKPSNMPPHELKLKENCIISLLRNVNPSQGLCNGTRLIVTKLYKTCIRAKIISGDFKGEEVLLSRYRMTSKTVDTSGELERVQFPVQLSFSTSMNKAQGQTFDTTGIYLRKPPFAHGQLFVAMSRSRSKKNLIVQVLPGPFMGKLKTNCNDVFVPNIVYKEVL